MRTEPLVLTVSNIPHVTVVPSLGTWPDSRRSPLPRWRPQILLLWILNALATLQFIRFYVISTHFYLNLTAYLSGQERLPFQERVLPILIMWPVQHSAWLMAAASHRGLNPDMNSAATPQTLGFYLVSLLSFIIAGFYILRLYNALTGSGLLRRLVYPAFLVVSLWTYVVHIDANYSYPYDMPSLAFFTAGLYYIYTRRFWPLVAVMVLGTFNRETTLFLIGVYLLDAASTGTTDQTSSFRSRFDLRTIPWARVVLLAVLWIVIKAYLAHIFSHNSRAEDYIRVKENLLRLKPRLLPTLLNICGYLLPILWVLRNRLRPIRFANYIYIFPVWIAVMFFSGVILETRIYGELCSFATVAAILLLEDHAHRAHGTATDAEILETAQVAPRPAAKAETRAA